MSIKEPMMLMIQNKVPGKTREELVDDLFKLHNIKEGDSIEHNKLYTSEVPKEAKN